MQFTYKWEEHFLFQPPDLGSKPPCPGPSQLVGGLLLYKTVSNLIQLDLIEIFYKRHTLQKSLFYRIIQVSFKEELFFRELPGDTEVGWTRGLLCWTGRLLCCSEGVGQALVWNGVRPRNPDKYPWSISHQLGLWGAWRFSQEQDYSEWRHRLEALELSLAELWNTMRTSTLQLHMCCTWRVGAHFQMRCVDHLNFVTSAWLSTSAINWCSALSEFTQLACRRQFKRRVMDVLAKARHILWVSIRSQGGPFKFFVFWPKTLNPFQNKNSSSLQQWPYCPCRSIHLYCMLSNSDTHTRSLNPQGRIGTGDLDTRQEREKTHSPRKLRVCPACLSHARSQKYNSRNRFSEAKKMPNLPKEKDGKGP